MAQKIIVSEVVKGSTALMGERYEFSTVAKLSRWLSRTFPLMTWRESSIAKLAAKAKGLGVKIEVIK
jgi:hypothetical protein